MLHSQVFLFIFLTPSESVTKGGKELNNGKGKKAHSEHIPTRGIEPRAIA